MSQKLLYHLLPLIIDSGAAQLHLIGDTVSDIGLQDSERQDVERILARAVSAEASMPDGGNADPVTVLRCRCVADVPEKPSDGLQQAAIVMLAGTPADAGSLLGDAVRRYPHYLLAVQAGAEQTQVSGGQVAAKMLPDSFFFAFGFNKRLQLSDGNVIHQVYEYSLSNYKKPPEWLNARFWANPERFDLID